MWKIVKNDKSFENDFEKLYLKKHSAIIYKYKIRGSYRIVKGVIMKKENKGRKAGFSLVEIIVVISIMAVLGMALVVFGMLLTRREKHEK